MKILITGGTGFIGKHLAEKLKLDHEVIVTGNSLEQKIEGVKLVHLGFQGIPPEYTEVDVVFHQAANNDAQCMDEELMMRANYYDPIYLFKKSYSKGCRKFIYASTTAVYGNEPAPYKESSTKVNPLTFYGKSKARFEEFARNFSDAVTVGLRYCNVYGLGESHKRNRASMIHQIIQKIIQNKSPKIFKYGQQKRDWVNVFDVVQANILAMNHTKSDIFNVGSGVASSFSEIVLCANKILGKNVEPEYIDNPYPNTYQEYTQCDITKMKKSLGYNPTISLEQGIKEMIYNYQPTLD